MSIDSNKAAYRILATHGFFGTDDHLYQEGEEIYFDGEPNEEMEPLNELARQRLTQYVEKLDALAKDVAEKTGRPYISRPRNLDGALALASEVPRANMSVMGNKTKEKTVERVEAADIPETSGQKRGRGRPTKASLAA